MKPSGWENISTDGGRWVWEGDDGRNEDENKKKEGKHGGVGYRG